MFFLLLGCTLWAQRDKITDGIVHESALLIYTDIGKGEKQATFVTQNQNRSENAARAFLVLADAAYLKGDFEAVIRHLSDAKKSTVPDSNVAIECDLYFTHYGRLFGFTEWAQQHDQQALERLLHFAKTDVSKSALWARYFLERSASAHTNESRAIDLLEAEKLLGLKNGSKPALHYQIQLALASSYVKLGDFLAAQKHLEPILSQESGVFKARALFEQALLEKARNRNYSVNLLQASRLLQTATDLPTQCAVYKELAEFYLNTNNVSAYKKVLAQYKSLDNQLKHNTKSARDRFIQQLEHSKFDIAQTNSYLFFAIAALLLLLSAGIYSYIKTKKDYGKFLKAVESSPLPEVTPVKTIVIPLKTEEALLEKLSKFEKSNKFTNANLTIQTLAKSLETNTKYLSEVINRNKNANFNQYLNELRISYIIAKMKEDPKYLNYKIYYLAKECGFSSQSTFSTVFRASTGISPLSFIKFLKNEKRSV